MRVWLEQTYIVLVIRHVLSFLDRPPMVADHHVHLLRAVLPQCEVRYNCDNLSSVQTVGGHGDHVLLSRTEPREDDG